VELDHCSGEHAAIPQIPSEPEHLFGARQPFYEEASIAPDLDVLQPEEIREFLAHPQDAPTCVADEEPSVGSRQLFDEASNVDCVDGLRPGEFSGHGIHVPEGSAAVLSDRSGACGA
jgi:hypothetical protein